MGKFISEKFDTISPVKRPAEVDTKWSQMLLKEMQEGLRKDNSPLKKKEGGSLKYQKELVSMKLNAKIKKLQKQKEQGEQEFEKARIDIKEFYKQIRVKIDEMETKAQTDLRANTFIRAQNF